MGIALPAYDLIHFLIYIEG